MHAGVAPENGRCVAVRFGRALPVGTKVASVRQTAHGRLSVQGGELRVQSGSTSISELMPSLISSYYLGLFRSRKTIFNMLIHQRQHDAEDRELRCAWRALFNVGRVVKTRPKSTRAGRVYEHLVTADAGKTTRKPLASIVLSKMATRSAPDR